MNNGIKNKLKELIGKEVNIHYHDSGISIEYPFVEYFKYVKGEILRFEEEDCILVKCEFLGGNHDYDTIHTEEVISIDFISYITTNIGIDKRV